MRTQDAKHIRTGIKEARRCFARYKETRDSSEYYIAVNKAYNTTLWHEATREAFEEISKKLCKRNGLPYWRTDDK